jgi:hypothetical protein
MTLQSAIRALGITRLCHLTPFRNLLHLAPEGQGLLSLRQLAEVGGDYDQQDLLRLDHHPDHISCSIEYPNGWYLKQRRLNATPIQRLFPDWVCLAINPDRLNAPGTRVCVRNAAAEGGRLIRDNSEDSLRALYTEEVIGAQGRRRSRTASRIAACPTDDQAEVLLQRSVPIDDIKAVIVASGSDARRFYSALNQIGAYPDVFDWVVAPTLLTTNELSSAIAAGVRPVETPWEPNID